MGQSTEPSLEPGSGGSGERNRPKDHSIAGWPISSWIKRNPIKSTLICLFALGLVVEKPPTSSSNESRLVPSIAEFDGKLTGKWASDGNVAPACPQNGNFFIRQSDGSNVIMASDGQIIDRSMWKVERVYDSNVAGTRIEHPGKAPIYWVVRISGNDMKTSIGLDGLPAERSEALEDLRKPDPKDPEIPIPILHKCAGDATAAVARVEAMQGHLQASFVQKTIDDASLTPPVVRRLPIVQSLYRRAITLAYYSKDMRCRDLWNDSLHSALDRIAVLDKEATVPGANDGLLTSIADEKLNALQASGCMQLDR